MPDSAFHGLEGLKYMGASIIPAIYNPHLANRTIEMETEAAHAMARRLARDEGLLVGISAAAAVVAGVENRQRGSAGRGGAQSSLSYCPIRRINTMSDRFWEEG